jgi:hypothetical protein
MASSVFLGAVAVALVLAAAPSALAGDPDYLQDVCVADLNSGKLLTSVRPVAIYSVYREHLYIPSRF